MIAFLLIIWTLALCLYYYLKIKEIQDKIKNIPSPPSCALLGHAHYFVDKPEAVFSRFAKVFEEFNKIAALWIGPWLNIFLLDPKDIDVVLKSQKLMNKSYHYEFLRPWLGDSILLSSGAKFQQNKKLLMQSFHANNLKQYLTIFNGQANDLVERLNDKVGTEEFNIHSYLSLCTMYSLLETSLGVDKETIGKEALDYSKAVINVGKLSYMRVCRLWLYPDAVFHFSSIKKAQDKNLKILNKLTNRVISQRKSELESKKSQNANDKKWTIFVDSFFKGKNINGEPYSEKEIRDEVMTMMFAGQDTTTVSIGFALSLLGYYQDIQDKVVEELAAIFGNSDRSVTYEDTQNLKYLEQVIQETWRLFPPIPIISKTPKQDIQLEKYVLPRDCTIVIPIILLNRNSEVYPNPNKFNPDNFLPEKIKERHPCSFIPFSIGSRSCIGSKYSMLIIKVVLATLLRKFKINSSRKMREYVVAVQITLHRKEGFLVSLEPRKMYVNNNEVC